MQKQAAILTNDLFFSSQLEGAASRAQIGLQYSQTTERLLEVARIQPLVAVIIDLAHPAANQLEDLLAKLKAIDIQPGTIIAYAQHVHTDRLKSARGAGCDHVTTRGDISRRLAELIGCR